MSGVKSWWNRAFKVWEEPTAPTLPSVFVGDVWESTEEDPFERVEYTVVALKEGYVKFQVRYGTAKYSLPLSKFVKWYRKVAV